MAVFQYLQPRIAHLDQEVFIILALTARNTLKRELWISQGTLTSCPVHPRDVFRPLIRESAAACILSHNHPSGSPEPSADDLTLTRRLVRSGELIGISIPDHVIIGGDRYVSLAERGAIP
jgi:DNA repair protein RadC